MTHKEIIIQTNNKRYYKGLANHEVSLVQFMISVLEDILVNLHVSKDIEYVQNRIGYYEERSLGLNVDINGPLSLTEIAELQAIAHDYYAVFETNLHNANDPILKCHLRMVRVVRDSLGAMLHG